MEDGGEPDGRSKDRPEEEEEMMSFIKTFQTDPLKCFLEGQGHLPPGIHPHFAKFRLALGTRHRQFSQLPDFKAQLAFFHDLFEELEVFPRAWVAYAVYVGYFFKQTGRFVEGSENIFKDQASLGNVLAMRSKYTILGLKDLISVRALTPSTDDTAQKTLVDNLLRFTSQVEMIGDGHDSDFLSALAGFDSDAWLCLESHSHSHIGMFDVYKHKTYRQIDRRLLQRRVIAREGILLPLGSFTAIDKTKHNKTSTTIHYCCFVACRSQRTRLAGGLPTPANFSFSRIAFSIQVPLPWHGNWILTFNCKFGSSSRKKSDKKAAKKQILLSLKV